MPDTVFTLQEVGIDWITATAPGGEQAQSLLCIGESWADLQVAADYKRKAWSKWGFIGESTRCVSYGRRGDEAVLVLSSVVADAAFSQVVSRAARISRLDLAVTVKTEPPLLNVARRHYGEFIDAGTAGRKGATTTLVLSSDGGSTCYLGRRISAKFLRIYDKWRESGEEAYKGCWRYELETKNEVALALARQLRDGPSRAGRIAATVYQHCAARGSKPIYSANTDAVLLPSPRPLTDLGKQCDWLARSVASTAQSVAGAVGVESLMTILGVDFQAKYGSPDAGGADHGHHAYEPDPDELDLDHEKGDLL